MNDRDLADFIQLVQTGLIIEDIANGTRRAIGYLAVAQQLDVAYLPRDIGLAARTFVEYVTNENAVPPHMWWLSDEERQRIHDQRSNSLGVTADS